MAENYGPTTLETSSADNVIGGTTHVVPIPITVANGAGELARGTVLGRITADGTHTAYAAAAVDGSENPVGILAEAVDASAAAVKTVMYVHGEFNKSGLTGIDDAAILALQAIGIYVREGLN